VTNFCFIASDGVKQERVSQNNHEPDDSVSIRFRRETYDAPEIDIASDRFTKENPPSYAVDFIDTRCAATRRKVGAQGVQEQAPVAGPSQALWDEWARYQSNLRQLDDPGIPRCPFCVPNARLYKTFTSSLCYSGESIALCPAICGTNPYHSITRNHRRIN
jgi:hypothetical protein